MHDIPILSRLKESKGTILRKYLRQFGSRLTTTRRLRRSLHRVNSDLPGYLRSLRVVVKRLSNWLKIGVQAGFGPNFTVEFEAEIPKKFGLA